LRKVFVSGCYDPLHAGHITFFRAARALGDHLTVCFASDAVLWTHKKRPASLPEEHKRAILESLETVDEVVIGRDENLGLDFASHFERLRPDVLAVTEDDRYEVIKQKLCEEVGAEYVVLPKSDPKFEPISSTAIVKQMVRPAELPLRVDLAGSWLDVPELARADGFVVNCAITPGISLWEWPYESEAGLGGSAAWVMLQGEQPLETEMAQGAGWQDPAVIAETGLCVWRSGKRPVLDLKRSGDLLKGRLALYWTEKREERTWLQRQWNSPRDLAAIAAASQIAREAVLNEDIEKLAAAMQATYKMQLAEGMSPLPEGDALVMKYCGRGWGGYAVALFACQADRDQQTSAEGERWRSIEPFCRERI